jgi:hypothetical protein
MWDNSMEPERLELEQVSGSYDEERQILNVTYRGAVTADVTRQVYAWIQRLITAYGLTTATGTVFDFREVTSFVVGNLTAIQYNSYQLNNLVDLHDHPVALLVSNIYQRAMVKAALNVTPQQQRKRIVHTLEGAWAFIEDWHTQEHSQPEAKPWG